MAATVFGKGPNRVGRIAIAWTSDGSGVATEATEHVRGTIKRVVFDPGATAPDDNWDCTLTDEHGMDLLGGQGANIDTANSSHIAPGVALKDGVTTSVTQPYVDGVLTLNVTNAGAAKVGTVYVYID